MIQNDKKTYGVSKERIETLFDSSTFVELGAYTRRSENSQDIESVVCGYGAVNGRLVFAFAQDSGINKGAFGERHAKKIADMYSLAIKNGAPVVGVFDSAGAVVYDGATAMAAYGRVMKCVSDASGIIPQIALIGGTCTGSAAVLASMFDVTVTVKNSSKLYVNSPFVTGEENSAAIVTASGLSVTEADNEEEAFAFVKKLINILPHNNAEGAVAFDIDDDINRTLSFDTKNYNINGLLTDISDSGSFIRLYEKYSSNICVGFARFGGVVSGIIASDPSNGGILDISSARIASRIVSFCDSFGIPVVTLVDSKGLDTSDGVEGAAYACELSRLAMAYTSSDNAKVTVVLGAAYGAAYTLLGSKSLGADIAYALDDACISVLSPEASVAFLWNDKVGERTREEVEDEWKAKYASAADAAACGEIDDVIEASELRKRICAALSMLAYKADGAPARKHPVMPL